MNKPAPIGGLPDAQKLPAVGAARAALAQKLPVRGRPRRGLILLVVLVMVTLLSLLAASYAFVVRANLSAAIANHQGFQARMAAESGLQHAVVMLRRNPDDPDYTEDLDSWYSNEAAFHGALVEGAEGEAQINERREENATYDPKAKPAWRFNLVAPNHDEPDTVRYGLTDECARLDINVATEAQLRRLFERTIPQDQDHPVDLDVLVDSLLDWRDGGEARSNGAISDYYMTLDPPYRCKGAPFSTVEELLLVRGFTAWVLFGEDYNRNGLLDFNEDDSDESFPPDNADGQLFAGVAPFLTVWSRELNVANNRHARINLNMPDTEKLQEQMQEAGFDGDIINYVVQVRGSGKTFNSVMNLIPAPPPPPEEEHPQEEDEQPAATQPSAEEAASQPTTQENGEENVESDEQGLSDQEQSEDTSENTRTLKLPTYQNLTEDEPPGGYEDLPLILDRLTVEMTPAFTGRINVSTAAPQVLATIQELTDEEVQAIVAARRELNGVDKATPAWLLSQGVIEEIKFRMLLDGKDLLDPKPGGIMTAKSSVYRVESLGYADHLGVIERLNVVFEMRGPIAQVLYYRNLGALGPAYRPHGVERRGIKGMSD